MLTCGVLLSLAITFGDCPCEACAKPRPAPRAKAGELAKLAREGSLYTIETKLFELKDGRRVPVASPKLRVVDGTSATFCSGDCVSVQKPGEPKARFEPVGYQVSVLPKSTPDGVYVESCLSWRETASADGGNMQFDEESVHVNAKLAFGKPREIVLNHGNHPAVAVIVLRKETLE